MIEIDVAAYIGGKIGFRTAVSNDPDVFPNFAESPVTPRDPYNPDIPGQPIHIRGYWPYSSFLAPAPDIDVCGDPLTQLVLGHASGSDTELFVKQLSDPFGTPNGNRGLYGVDCNFAYKIRNKCDEAHEAFAFIMARNTGSGEEVPGKFWGAAHLISTAAPQQPEIGVDLIQYGDPLDGCCRVSAAGPLIIPAKSIEGYNGPIDALLRFAVGGASDLPVNFVSSNHDIVPGP